PKRVFFTPPRSKTLLGLIRVEPETQRLRAGQGDEITLTAPGPDIAERRKQIVVGLRAVGRAIAILHRPGDKDDSVAGDRELALAALAPELESPLAFVADVERRDALGAGHARGIQRHLEAEGKLLLGARRTCRNSGREQREGKSSSRANP